MATDQTGVSGDSSLGRRAPLPEGTLPVGAALLISGLATYAFFKVGKVAMGGDVGFAPVAAMWFATFSLAPGFFLPLEQELGRALSARRARGEGGQPVVERVTRIGVLIAAVVLLGIALSSPLLVKYYFDGDWVMVAALATAFAAYAPAHLARGICAGEARFRSYAIVMGSDGIVRITMCLLLAGIGIKSAGPYGFVVALAPLAAVGFVFFRGDLRTDPGPAAPQHEVSQNLGWLLLGTVFAAALLNAGVVAINLLRSPDQKELVSQFSYGVLLARIPLFLFQAVMAALLPRLSRLAARGDFDEFRHGYRTLMKLVGMVGVIGVVGGFLLGPWVIQVMYDVELSGVTLALLALSSALYMGALATAQAVIALRGHALVAYGWISGFVVFVLVTLLVSHDLFRRIELGLVASSVTAFGVLLVSLRSRLDEGATPTSGSLMEAITDMPLEA